MSGISYQCFERDFRVQKKLGKGNYAVVNQVLHLLDQHSYAHKCIEFTSLEELSLAFNEIEAIKCIDDDRIVKLAYYYTRENKRTGKYELGIIMELCYSTLAELMRARKRKNDYFSRTELKEFLSAMIPLFAKMQKKGYMHRDIKPDNILLVKNAYNKLEYKIGDFGFAIKHNAYSTQNIAGTMEYVSPKLMVKFKDNKVIVPGHNFRDDVYSFGKTLCEYMTLECNEKALMERKSLECSSRYGAEYWGLANTMMKVDENERPDFEYLERYCIQKQLISVPDNGLGGKHNFLSISTVNGMQMRKELSLDRVSEKKKKGFSKGKEDLAKTKKKEPETDSDATAIEVTGSKVPKAKEEKKKKVIAFGEVVHCLLASDNFLFVGSEGKLGIVVLATEKIMKLKLQGTNTPITCMKSDSIKKFLLFGTMIGKLYIVEIHEIKKLIIENPKLFEKKGEQELEFKQIRHCEMDASLPVSAFDCCYLQDKKEPIYIIGHYTGEMTIIKGETKTSKISFSREPITHLLYRGNFLYSSYGDGSFRRESGLSLGLWGKQGEKMLKPFREMKSCSYKHSELIVAFELIEQCAYNRTVTKEENKYLAILISYDGLAHIVSRSFRLQRLIRISHHSIITAIFEDSPTAELGVQGWMSDSEGELFSESGKSLHQTEQRNVSCLSVLGSSIYLGTYGKQLLVVGREEVVIV